MDYRTQRALSRRSFLKALTATAIVTPLAGCPEDTDGADASVVIIGAGISGLSAARRLKQLGFENVVILEARNYVGGRIRTDRSLGVPVDMGASWIHGPTGNPISELADAAGSSTFVTNDESLDVFDASGNLITDDVLDATYRRFIDLLEAAKEVAVTGQSLSEAIRLVDESALADPLMVYHLSAYTEFDAGGAIEDLSALEWDGDEAFRGSDVLLPSGYDTVVNHVANGLDIRLNQVVQSISRSGNSRIVIQTNQGSFDADYCICTLPIGVLKSGDIEFDPILPEAFQDAISHLGAGHVNKVALRFPGRFWDESVQYVGFTSAVKGRYPYIMNVDTFAPSANMLMTFGFGAYGLQMEDQTNEEIQVDIMNMLNKIYGAATVSPESMLVSRWTSDPFSKCSYSFAKQDTVPGDFMQFEESAYDDRLIFAGEHTSVDYRGTVHGAYLSGLRAADHIYDQKLG